MDDTPRILGGRYEVGELIGRGGMAEVHVGRDTRLGRTVAIKILRSDLARDPSFQARFRREAQAAASLNHPAVVAVYDTGEDVSTEPGGAMAHVPFIVMEYVEGHTVRDILREGQPVTIEEALEITAGVLSALEYSHRAGIVHRDIKPANVMLTQTGAVKVMDFGIARAMADAAGTMTQTQAVIGTAQYLSPEQARGEAVDFRSDLYSTGCLLFELLTGRPPFIGDSPVAVAYQHAREEPRPPSTYASDVPEALDRITLKALAKDREHRYRSAVEFRHDLEQATRGGVVSAPAVPPVVASGPSDPGAAATQVMSPQTAATQALPPVAAPAAAWGPTGAQQQTTRSQMRTAPPTREEQDEPRRTWLIWLLVVVGLVAIAGIVFALTRGEAPETTVDVPEVGGMTSEEAVAEITRVGLEARPAEQPSAEVAAGLVVGTDPEAGEAVEPGSDVTVYVSTGPEPFALEDLSSLTEEQAETRLRELGFTELSFQVEHSGTIEAGRVTKTDPAAGTEIADPGATRVTVYVSDGKVDVPDYRDGATPSATAKAALEALGLTVVVEQQESTSVEPGLVVDQSAVGTVAQRSVVTLFEAVPPEVVTTVVPEVLGQLYSEAAAELGAANLNAVAGVEEFSDTVAAGRVIRTDPAAGQELPEGSNVTVIVSKGADPDAGGGGGGGGGTDG